MTPDEYKALAKPKKRSKFKAIRTEVDGIKFASKREARRYQALKKLKDLGKIDPLLLQVRYPLPVNGLLICTYVADFLYKDVHTGEKIVEDAKGYPTPEYKLKRKLMKAIYNIDIIEV